MKLGIMETSSNFLANIPFKKPPSANSNEVRMMMLTITRKLCIASLPKISDTRVTTVPTIIPRTIPPVTYPERMMKLGVGVTWISSMERWNFALKKDDETLAYELVITDIKIRPGTIKSM